MLEDAVLVIGSGPCGAIAAAQLVKRGVSVVMLDAGGHVPRGVLIRAAGNTLFRRIDWSGYRADRVDPSSSPDIDWYSSLTHGGLSNFWTGAVPRFAPDDFTDGARLDERYRWPLGYDDLLPFYEIVERLLTVTGGDPIAGVPPNLNRYTYRPPPDWRRLVATAAQQGHPFGVLPMAKGSPWMAARRGTAFTSYHCIVAPLLQSDRFEVIPNARAVRLNWNPAVDRVDSVTYVDGATRRLAHARGRAVIVAAGAIDSTVLLLRSRSSDFPSGLGNTEGLAGRYLHDHPREWWTATPSTPLRALSHPVYLAREPHEASEPLMATSLTLGLVVPYERIRIYYRGRSRQLGVQVLGTMIPTPDLGVELLDPLADEDAKPRITLRYDEATVANLVTARDRLRDVFRSGGTQIEIPGPFHKLRPGSSVHYGGTIRMHHDRRCGLLDGWNRLHDVRNVIVADSSCFTTGPEKNPTLTAMAIAARAADRLAKELNDGGRF
jgi:choline dehydrogenase-like flavoprotein